MTLRKLFVKLQNMSTRIEALREEMVESGSPLIHHSLNQKKLRSMIDGEHKAFGNPDSKGARAQRRRKSTKRFIEELPGCQFNRSLEHMLDGGATDEDIFYILRHIEEHEKRIGRTDNGTQITRVNFTRTRSQE